jgi:orotate phosphoribosyltransferase
MDHHNTTAGVRGQAVHARPLEADSTSGPATDEQLAARVATAPGLVRPGASCWDHARTPIHALSMESAYADPALLRDLRARGGRFAREIGVEVVAGAETAGVPLAASISLSSDLPFAFVRKPGYRGHEIDEPPFRGADVSGRRTLLVDDAISSGTSIERFAASLAGVGAEVVGVFVLVDMRDVADTVSPGAAALPTDAVSTYLQVLKLATANGLLDPTLHELAVDAIVNRWSDDDPRWDLLPATAHGPSTVPLRDACPFIGADSAAATAGPVEDTLASPRHQAKRHTALSKESLEYRFATASAATNPELLLEYQRQVLEPAAKTSEPGRSAAIDGNQAPEPAGTESAQRDAADPRGQ